MKIISLPIEDIFPYENNPRKNDKAVNAVMESIKQCDYIAPIIVCVPKIISGRYKKV